MCPKRGDFDSQEVPHKYQFPFLPSDPAWYLGLDLGESNGDEASQMEKKELSLSQGQEASAPLEWTLGCQCGPTGA